MFKIIALSTLLSTNISDNNTHVIVSQSIVNTTIPTDPSLIGSSSVNLNGCVVLSTSTELKEWYQFDLQTLNFATEKDAMRFCGMNSTNLFRLHVDFANQKGYVQLYPNRAGAPTSITAWNNYFIQQCQ